MKAGPPGDTWAFPSRTSVRALGSDPGPKGILGGAGRASPPSPGRGCSPAKAGQPGSHTPAAHWGTFLRPQGGQLHGGHLCEWGPGAETQCTPSPEMLVPL